MIVLQALEIDEKIGYPEYLGSDNVTELEEDYAEVRKNKQNFYYIFIRFSMNSIHLIFIIF
jgi:hypothetical protein